MIAATLLRIFAEDQRMHDLAIVLMVCCLLALALLNRAVSFDRLRDPE